MSWRESFMDVFCAYRRQLGVVLLFLMTLGFMNLVTVVFGTPGTGSHVLSIINMALILGFGVVVGSLYYACGRREQTEFARPES